MCVTGVSPHHQLHPSSRVGSNTVGWSQLYSFTSAPSAAAVAAGSASFTFLVFNDVGQENAVLFDNVCPPYCPAGWAFEDYTANSAKLMRHLEAESEARLGLLVGENREWVLGALGSDCNPEGGGVHLVAVAAAGAGGLSMMFTGSGRPPAGVQRHRLCFLRGVFTWFTPRAHMSVACRRLRTRYWLPLAAEGAWVV